MVNSWGDEEGSAAPPALTAAAPADSPEGRALLADDIIKNHVILGMAAGLVPLPAAFDIGAVIAIQVHMIAKLAKVYANPVPQKLVLYKILFSVVGGIGPAYLSVKFSHLIKALPTAASLAYLAALSVSGGASVYAVGKVFQKHFESGGTFLSKDNATLRHYYKAMFEDGKKVARGMVSA